MNRIGLGLLICILILVRLDINGQIIGSNCFLKGNFVEVGINSCGAYGSDESPPGAFHETTPFTGLGFVADPGEDGWTTGSPKFCGDYFVPGAPVEGWMVQIGASTWTNSDQDCASLQVPGAISDYYYAAGEYVCIWEGDIPDENVHITQKTTVPQDAVYFLTEVTFCNDGLTDITDLYYKRNVDPDPDVNFGADYFTQNVIVVNPPDTCTALVTATGNAIGCFMGMGALDLNARSSYGLFQTDDATCVNSWNGTGGYTGVEGSELLCDCATQITFKIPIIPAGECRTVTFAYILKIEDLTDALEATLPVDIEIDGNPAPTNDTLFICNYNEIEIEISGGEGYEWTWTYDGGIGDVTNTNISHFTPDSDGYITMEGTGGFCGTLYRKLYIVYEGDITANAGEDADVCYGATILLNGSGGYSYVWSPETGLSDSTDEHTGASPLETTTYTLTAYTQHGCFDVDNVIISVIPPPIVSAGEDGLLCPEGSIQLHASGASEYTWEPSTGLSCNDCPDPICTVDAYTVYTVTGTDDIGCFNTDEVIVDLYPPLNIVATEDPSTIDVYQGETSQLNATGADTYSWTPPTGLTATNIPNPVANPSDTTVYYVTGTDENGCIAIDSIIINVIGELIIGVPTAFSPNGDGINDLWTPMYSGSGFLDSYLIYNRWGQLVYTGNASSIGWNGEFEGKPQVIDTYTVVIKAHTTKEEQKFIAGNFTLVR